MCFIFVLIEININDVIMMSLLMDENVKINIQMYTSVL